jgi:hypothetical protein
MGNIQYIREIREEQNTSQRVSSELQEVDYANL